VGHASEKEFWLGGKCNDAFSRPHYLRSGCERFPGGGVWQIFVFRLLRRDTYFSRAIIFLLFGLED
jgi:hypothetical protein